MTSRIPIVHTGTDQPQRPSRLGAVRRFLSCAGRKTHIEPGDSMLQTRSSSVLIGFSMPGTGRLAEKATHGRGDDMWEAKLLQNKTLSGSASSDFPSSSDFPYPPDPSTPTGSSPPHPQLPILLLLPWSSLVVVQPRIRPPAPQRHVVVDAVDAAFGHGAREAIDHLALCVPTQCHRDLVHRQVLDSKGVEECRVPEVHGEPANPQGRRLPRALLPVDQAPDASGLNPLAAICGTVSGNR